MRVAIRKQAEANTVEVSKRVLAEIEAVNRAFPQIQVVPVINQGNFIERSIANVARSVLYGGGLAVMVLLFFLRNIRSTVVISLAIPISIIATFALIYFGGFTLNLMTLGGLALGVGMMVDSSMVVLENIFRRSSENGEIARRRRGGRRAGGGHGDHRQHHHDPGDFPAAGFCARVSGILFKELAYVIIFSLICSLLVSLSLVPMLASRLLRVTPAAETQAPGREDWTTWSAASERFFNGLDNGYRRSAARVLRHRLMTVCCGRWPAGASLLLCRYRHRIPAAQRRRRSAGHRRDGSRHPAGPGRPADPDHGGDRLSGGPGNRVFGGQVGASGLAIRRAAEGDHACPVPAAQTEPIQYRDRQRPAAAAGRQDPGHGDPHPRAAGQFLLERLLGGDEGLTIEMRGFDLETLDALADSAWRKPLRTCRALPMSNQPGSGHSAAGDPGGPRQGRRSRPERPRRDGSSWKPPWPAPRPGNTGRKETPTAFSSSSRMPRNARWTRFWI